MGEIGQMDFRTMIRSPFWDCPKCGKKSYGILSVHAKHYVRRCRDCRHTSDHLRLPPLNKKVIYLDQFVISEMAKVNEPNLRKNLERPVNKIWPKMLEKLQLLIRAQMVVCPESECHFFESLAMDSGYESLKALYEGVSGGVQFESPKEIQTRQISRTLRCWLSKEPVVGMATADVIIGKIDSWADDFTVSLNVDWSSIADILRQERSAVEQSLCNVLRQWRGDQHCMFDDWAREQTIGVVKLVVDSYKNARDAFNKQPEDSDVFVGYTQHPMHRIWRDLQDGGIQPQKQCKTLCEFFRSTDFSEIPSVKISALMFAAIAQQAAHQGRKKPLNRGFSTDVAAISTFLPFCDAMFIDKECWTILTQNPVRDRLGFKTRLYSVENFDDFFAYLDTVGRSVSPEHFGALREVYGDEFVETLCFKLNK